MEFLRNITKLFNGVRTPSPRQMYNVLVRMGTPEGRAEFLGILAVHPEFVNSFDEYGRIALRHAASAGDVNTMGQLIKAGIQPHLLPEAICSAACSGKQEALDLLLNAGAVVTPEHLDKTRESLKYFSECEDETGTARQIAGNYKRALRLLKAAYRQQEEERAEPNKQIGPLVLADKIIVRGPLKLRGRNTSFQSLASA